VCVGGSSTESTKLGHGTKLGRTRCYLYIYRCFYLSICSSVCLSIFSSIHLSIYTKSRSYEAAGVQSARVYRRVQRCAPTICNYLSISIPIVVTILLAVCLSVYLSFCLFIYLFIHHRRAIEAAGVDPARVYRRVQRCAPTICNYLSIFTSIVVSI